MVEKSADMCGKSAEMPKKSAERCENQRKEEKAGERDVLPF
ncbi:hypothetical protein B4099_1541 [Heyndrickxia coagulans]|uniref:Uncharacterized protein n=1 Tax=Heyndrickxia coagulans TaxID=1398 RepID=A0A150KIE7_HEYCO|nr:hypothetical protein B4099_1541 [Heyndrickxia coagulans]